jgi:hypothetical protein
MDEELTGTPTLSDEDLSTRMGTSSASAMETRPGDGTDGDSTDTTDGDSSDGDSTDGTDGDSGDQDGTDGADADGTDATDQ